MVMPCSVSGCSTSSTKRLCGFRAASLPCRHPRWREDWQRALAAWLAVAALLAQRREREGAGAGGGQKIRGKKFES